MKNTPKILTCKRVKSKNDQTRRRRVLTDSYRRSDAANNIETKHIFSFSFQLCDHKLLRGTSTGCCRKKLSIPLKTWHQIAQWNETFVNKYQNNLALNKIRLKNFQLNQPWATFERKKSQMIVCYMLAKY